MQTTPLAKPSSIVNRSPVYYGWIVWLAATVAFSATMPGQTASISRFNEFWIAEFGLDNRSTISALYGVGTFIASLTLTFVGNRVDKHGTRFMSIVIGVLFVLALLYMSLVNNLAMLMVGFFLIRGLGQGSLFLIGSTAVANWFQRMRGRVMAFALIGFSLFQRWYIPFIQGLLETYGWRTVWLILAAGIAVIALPMLGLLLRETPELFGVLPDGDKPSKIRDEAMTDADDTDFPVGAVPEVNYPLRDVVRLPIFWVFAYGGMMSPAFLTGIIFHQESLFAGAGYDADVAAEWLANGLLLAGFATLLAGFLIDRLRPSYVRVLELAALASILVLSAFIGVGAWTLPLWAVLLAMSNGMGSVFDGAVYANLFGRRHLGEIRGFVQTLGVTGTAAGPLLLSLSFDATGTYTVSLLVGAVAVMVPMVAAFFVTQPRQWEQNS